jgi:hypothetical protein
MNIVRPKSAKQRPVSPSGSTSSSTTLIYSSDSSSSGSIGALVGEEEASSSDAPLTRRLLDKKRLFQKKRPPLAGKRTANSNRTAVRFLSHRLAPFVLGCCGAALVALFSRWFPFQLAPDAATKTYLLASYQYNPETSHFDNTTWTYGTDYMLGIVLSALSLSVPVSPQAFVKLSWLTRCLLLSYVVSVTAGGLAHQFFLTVPSQNTVAFRCLWTVCVGTVALATGFMGAISTELLRYSSSKYNLLPVVPGSLWVGFASCVTAMVAAGWFSYQRPACDIFIVGITQFPSTFYMVPALLFEDRTDWRFRVMGVCGFLLNAPLLPLYPMLVQYTDWSLGSINTLLHFWLLVAWSMQGLSLRAVGKAWAATHQHIK